MSDTTKIPVVSVKVLRVIIGVIAISLAPATFFLSSKFWGLTSISISYWTDAQDIFVGSLIAVGFFLAAYNGKSGKKDFEFYLGKLACICAIIVAFFPTANDFNSNTPTWWVESISALFSTEPMVLHYIFAVTLFGCLIGLMWFFSKHAENKGKHRRAKTYKILGALMILGMLILGLSISADNKIFWVEAWGLSVFGITWLIAGSYEKITFLNK